MNAKEQIRNIFMGQSMTVVGQCENSQQWEKMRDAYWACKDAGIKIPQEVLEFFDYSEPGDESEGGWKDIDLPPAAMEEYSNGEYLHEGCRVDLSKIPDGVTHILFYNSY